MGFWQYEYSLFFGLLVYLSIYLAFSYLFFNFQISGEDGLGI